MASIKERNGSYLITVSKGYVDGKKQLVTTTFKPNLYTAAGNKKTKKSIMGEVQHFAFEFEEEVRKGLRAAGNKTITVRKFMEEWCESYGKMKLEKRTLEDYKKMLNLYVIPQIGGLKVADIGSGHIQEIVNSMLNQGKTAGTIRKTFVVMTVLFRYAKAQRIIAVTPCDRDLITLPAQKPRRIDLSQSKQEHIWTVAQSVDFLKFCSRPYSVTHKRKNGTIYTENHMIPLQMQCFFHLALYTGARRGELLALKWSDILWSERKVEINKAVTITEDGEEVKSPKTDNGYRVLELTTQSVAMLKRWHVKAQELALMCPAEEWEGLRGDEFDENRIFIQDNGKPMCSTSPYQALKRAITAYNTCHEANPLPMLRLHDLRHTNASMQIYLGVSLADTSRNLGHGDVATTARYYTHGQETAAHTASLALEKALG